jgi:hypothetical protein
MKIYIYLANCAPFNAACATVVNDDGTMVHGFAFTDLATKKHHFSFQCLVMQCKFSPNRLPLGLPSIKVFMDKHGHASMYFNLVDYKTWPVPVGFTIPIDELNEMPEEIYTNWMRTATHY